MKQINGLAMHRNFNDLKTKTMEYKELVKHHTQLIKDQNENKWEVIETSDLEEICETYHQAKLKLLGIGVVSKSFTPKQIVELLKEEETLDDAISFFNHQSNVC